MLAGAYAAQFEDNQRLCAQKNMVGCFNLGVMYMKGMLGAQKDASKALEYFTKACDGGDIDGCLNAGKYFEDGEEITKDLHLAVTFYTKACDAGEAYGCMILANLYHHGKDTLVKDHKKAAYYYKKVCEEGYSGGCKQYDKIRRD